MQVTEHKTFQTPDETREFPEGRAEILKVGDSEVGRLVFEPGWRWSNDVKPIAQTESCEAPHFQYHVSGQLAIRMDDGTEFTAGPGRRHVPAERTRRMGRRATSRSWSSTGSARRTTPRARDAPVPQRLMNDRLMIA